MRSETLCARSSAPDAIAGAAVAGPLWRPDLARGWARVRTVAFTVFDAGSVAGRARRAAHAAQNTGHRVLPASCRVLSGGEGEKSDQHEEDVHVSRRPVV